MRKMLFALGGAALIAVVVFALRERGNTPTPLNENRGGIALAAAGQVPEQARGTKEQKESARGTAGQTELQAGKPASPAKKLEASPKKLRKASPRTGMTAISQAARSKKYLFMLFYKNMDNDTQRLKELFDTTMRKTTDRAESITINALDPSEKPVVDKFNLSRAPMPLVLALAPNGAITGGFPTTFDEKKLLTAFVSPCMQTCLKALQDRKLVFVCVQNQKTKSNAAAMQGVKELKSDKRYAKITEIVKLDPSDTKEVTLLRNLQIDQKTAVATTALLSPPGSLIAKITGATTKKVLLAKLAAAGSG